MKFYNWQYRRRAILPPALLMLLCVFPVSAHSASSYLQELEAEAASTDNEKAVAAPEQAKTPGWAPHDQSLSEKIGAGLTKAQFEERLKQSYYGSYLFYSTLDDADQQRVYEDYRKDNAINSIRESIKSRMKNQ